MYTVHKIRLYPNNKQRTFFERSCGTARFAYNWALNRWKEHYEAGEKTSESKLRKELNAIKKTEFPWMYEVSKCCVQYSIKNLGVAFSKFFKKQAKYPRFKSKYGRHSFTLDYLNFKLKGKRIQLAKLGDVRLAEEFRFEKAKLLEATISKEAGQWYASILCEVEDCERLPKNTKVVGIDVGVYEYVMSDGSHYPVPRVYRKYEKKLRRLNQSLSRKVKGSSNRAKDRVKVAKCHQKIKNIRKDWLHKLTTNIVKNNDVIAIEDLNVRGMIRNKHLSKSISDASFGEFRRQIEYKSQRYGRLVVTVPRFYPSSKLCSGCNTKTKVMPLSVRSWTCEVCGEHHDRDVNAAINIRKYAVSSTVPAYGEFLAYG